MCTISCTSALVHVVHTTYEHDAEHGVPTMVRELCPGGPRCAPTLLILLNTTYINNHMHIIVVSLYRIHTRDGCSNASHTRLSAIGRVRPEGHMEGHRFRLHVHVNQWPLVVAWRAAAHGDGRGARDGRARWPLRLRLRCRFSECESRYDLRECGLNYVHSCTLRRAFAIIVFNLYLAIYSY